MTKYLGNDIYEIDGKKYSIKKAKEESEALLHNWTCPSCGHSQMSYKDETTAANHVCKKRKKK